MSRPTREALATLALLLGAGAASGPTAHAQGLQAANTDWTATGRDLYVRYCASCHGTSARGDGPVADVLSVRPADLTGLAARYGRPLPTEQLAGYVDGRADVAAHGPRQMPVWGERLYAGAQPGPASDQLESARRGSIELILLYLESIQAPVNPEVPR